MTYEYKRLLQKSGQRSEFLNNINQLGSENWEIVSILGPSDYVEVFLRRETHITKREYRIEAVADVNHNSLKVHQDALNEAAREGWRAVLLTSIGRGLIVYLERESPV